MTWLAISALFLLATVSAGLESAFTSIPAARFRHEAKRHRSETIPFHSLFGRRASLIATTLLAGLIAHLLALCLLIQEAALHFDQRGLWIAAAIYLPLQILVVQILPKTIFPHLPLPLLFHLSRPVLVLHRIFGPFLHLFSRIPNSRPISATTKRDAFLEVTDLAGEEGTLTSEETEIIHQTLEFDRTTAGSLMLPLRKVTAIPLGMPVARVLQLARDTDLDQFPVMDEHGNFIGLAPVFELLKSGQQATGLRPFLHNLVRIPKGTKALRALQILRLNHTEIGMITGPRDRDLGIISSCDIVQALLSPEFSGVNSRPAQ